MKVASIEKIELIIAEAEAEIKKLEDQKGAVISQNANAINVRIQEKLKAISEQIKLESINEICGKEIAVIENNIEYYKDKIETLNSVIFETEETKPEGEQPKAEENEAAEPAEAAETAEETQAE